MTVEVVGLALPAGPRWVDELRRAWDAGHAVAPLDDRLPAPARRRQLELLAPTVVVDESGPTREPTGRPAEPGDALIVATSGTTGQPRAAVLDHQGLTAGACATASALDVDPAADRWLGCLPVAHVAGLGVVVRAVLTDTPVELLPGFDAAAVATARDAGATLVSLVPAVLDRVDVTGFRTVLLGGSAVPAVRPANCVATYGMTETGGGVVYDGSPLEGVECRAVDGEIQLRGPMLLRCYRDGHDPRTGDGWFPTGDLGAVTDGVVSVQGRASEVIITGGEKVWPAPVEAEIDTHPRVRAAAVVGRPDPVWGQIVTAVVESDDVDSPPTLDELRALVGATLPRWCEPRRLELVERLPRTSLGKIKRSAL